MPDLTRRCRQPEVMDQPGLAERDHQAALTGLVRINWISNSTRILWPAIAKLARAKTERPLRVLDIATGAGDIPLRLWRRAQRSNVRLDISACDISATALGYARRRSGAAGAPLRFFALDALRDDLPDDFDVVTSSLFLHHLDEHEASSFLRRLGAAARQAVLVNDLVRSPTGYVLAWLATRFLTGSWVARIDGPLSIRGAFTCAEVAALARAAGLDGATITRHWPQRFLWQWSRPA